MIHLSATKLATYKECPHKYWLNYVKQSKKSIAPALRFGTLIHKMAEDFHKWANVNKDKFNSALAIVKAKEICDQRLEHYKNKYARDLIILGYDKLDIYNMFLDEYITYFVTNNLIQKKFVPEQSFSAPMGKYLLKGKIDLFIDPNIVIDFKTGATVPDTSTLSNSLQVKFYSIIRNEPMAFSYIYLKRPMVIKSFSVARPNEQIIKEIIKQAEPIVQARQFPKTHNNCEYCNFRFTCRPDIFKKDINSPEDSDYDAVDTV